MSEGIAPQTKSGGVLDALQFLTPSDKSLVGSLLADVQSTQISSGIFTLNLVAFSIAACFFIPRLYSRLLMSGNTGELDADKSLAAWANKCLIAFILATPAPDFSIGQRLVIFLTSAGSALGDRIAVEVGSPHDALRLNLRYGATSSASTPTPPAAKISPEGAAIVARIFEARWCQLHLINSTKSEPGRPTSLPPPVETTRFDGSSVLQFGTGDGANATGGIAADICGSLTLPLPKETREEAKGLVASAKLLIQNVSDVSRPILTAHRAAIETASTTAAIAVLQYPISTRDAHLVNADVAAARGKMRDASVAIAREYDKTVSAAGGATTRAAQAQTPAGSANALDVRWGWIRFGLDFHRRAASATATATALSWIPSFTPASLTDQLNPKWKQNFGFMQDDLRAAGLIPTVPPSALGQATSGSGFDIASLVGADKIINAMQIFSDPYADTFEVAGLVGPVFTQIASAGLAAYAVVSAAIPGIGSFVSFVLGTMLTVGQILSVVLPLAPLVGWLMLILGWFVLVITTLIAVPLASIALVRDDSSDLLGGAMTPLISKTLTLVLLPTLLVLGVTLITPTLQLAWLVLATAIMPTATAVQQGSALGVVFGGVIAALFVISIVVSTVYYAVTKIAAVPNAVNEFLQAQSEKSPGVGERISGNEHISSTPALGRAGAPSGKTPTPGSSGGGGAGGNTVAASVPPPR